GASPGAAKWDKMPVFMRKNLVQNALAVEAIFSMEWAEVDREAVRKLAMPTLLLSGEKTLDGFEKCNEELTRLVPEKNRQAVVIPGASHGMWWTHAEQTRKALLEFLKGK